MTFEPESPWLLPVSAGLEEVSRFELLSSLVFGALLGTDVVSGAVAAVVV